MLKFLPSLVALAALSLSTPPPSASAAPQDVLYTGKGSLEAVLTFDHEVELIRTRPPSRDEASDAVEEQILYLFGPMSAAQYPAVPKLDHRITRIHVQPKIDTKATYVISYHYEGTIALRRGPRSVYTILLPVNPERIYAAGKVRSKNGITHPCTDPDYQDPDDFWYFWNPAQEGCPLVEGHDYRVVRGHLRLLPSTSRTFPEYDRLKDTNGNISIHLLMGMDDPDMNDRNPLTSRDMNAETFRELRRRLHGLRFKSAVWPEKRIRETVQDRVRQLPYIEEFTKSTPAGTLIVRLFFGATGIDEDSRAFHLLLKDALEHGSVMIYDGHSGLGGHLDLASIESASRLKIHPNPKQYQIYFFNSCSSYPYFNLNYFARKATRYDRRGTRNLDILANGLATDFEVEHETNLALIQAIDAWATRGVRTSYQELASRIDSGNLFGVNGDEDNPKY